MSREKLQKSRIKGRQNTQPFEIIEDLCQKKFGGNVSQMARWLDTSDANVHRWLAGTTVPAWVVLRIQQERENFLVKDTSEEYKADKLNRDLLKPFLPMAMLMWLVRELPRVDAKLGDRVLRAVCEHCAFEDQMVWEVGQ